MEISVRKQRSVQVIRLKGPLRLGPAVEDFKKTLRGFVAEGEVNLVLVLNEVPMIDSSGIGELIRTQKTCKEEGGDIKLVEPGKFVLHTMNLVKITELFDIHPDENAAVEAFGDDA
jgi:anti-anti-sigma factor